MSDDQIFVLEDAEITVQAAVADLKRASIFLANDVHGVWRDEAYGLAADVDVARRLLLKLARPRDEDDPLEGANCHLCGATADNFHVPDDLWERVGLGPVQACFKCFRIAAWHAGVTTNEPWEVNVGG